MAKFGTDDRGGIDDRVRLELDGKEVLIAETYEVTAGVLSQPAAFSLRLGHGDVAAKIIRNFPPKTPFKLFIGDAVQQSGETDGFVAEGSAGATGVTIRGRDALAPLHDGFVDAEKSFKDATYTSLVGAALKAVGITTGELVVSARADRQIKAGVKIVELAPPRTVDEIIADAGKSDTGASFQVVLQSKLGERWYEFVRRHIDRAGLFLWAGVKGDFILSQPNAQQKPAYRIVRQRGKSNNAVNVVSAEFQNETTHRYSEIIIYGRGGGRKFGRTKSKGKFTDDEMIALGYKRPLVLRDANVQSVLQAQFLARRKLAEAKRQGFALTYKLAGHSTPTIDGKDRAVWSPDTIVEVEDDEFAIKDLFYIENVVHRRAPETTTTIRLMRPDDLIFGGPDG